MHREVTMYMITKNWLAVPLDKGCAFCVTRSTYREKLEDVLNSDHLQRNQWSGDKILTKNEKLMKILLQQLMKQESLISVKTY